MNHIANVAIMRGDKCIAHVAVYPNPLAPRPEYYVTLTKASGKRQRFYYSSVRGCAGAVKRVHGQRGDTVEIQWL